MKKTCLVSVLLAVMIALGLSLSPAPTWAIPYLDFNMDAIQPGASISFDGYGLNGVNISVDTVTGFDTPSNSGFTGKLNGGTLTFFSSYTGYHIGSGIGSDLSHWDFGSGTINLVGAVAFEGSNIPPNTTLLTGTIT